MFLPNLRRPCLRDKHPTVLGDIYKHVVIYEINKSVLGGLRIVPT